VADVDVVLARKVDSEQSVVVLASAAHLAVRAVIATNGRFRLLRQPLANQLGGLAVSLGSAALNTAKGALEDLVQP
jgi:hypothetical protein